jgi:hypothetical protein
VVSYESPNTGNSFLITRDLCVKYQGGVNNYRVLCISSFFPGIYHQFDMENPQVVCVLLLLKYSHKTRRLEITASASVISKFSCSVEDDNSFIAFQVSLPSKFQLVPLFSRQESILEQSNRHLVTILRWLQTLLC